MSYAGALTGGFALSDYLEASKMPAPRPRASHCAGPVQQELNIQVCSTGVGRASTSVPRRGRIFGIDSLWSGAEALGSLARASSDAKFSMPDAGGDPVRQD
jgi:hypothetical protein